MLTVNIGKISFTSSQQNSLLKNIDFTLEKNLIYTLVGKNGEGKTTLLKSLTNLTDKNKFIIEGSVLFDGKNILAMSDNELSLIRKEKIKHLFQDSLKSFDQLKKMKYYFDLFQKENEVDELLEYFNLPNRKRLEKMYPSELSYGMAQRLGFVFAISLKPSILIMDEPTSSLDSEIVNLFRTKIKNFVKENNSTVLLATHDLTFVKEISDFVSILEKNTISDFLPTQQFFETRFPNLTI